MVMSKQQSARLPALLFSGLVGVPVVACFAKGITFSKFRSQKSEMTTSHYDKRGSSAGLVNGITATYSGVI